MLLIIDLTFIEDVQWVMKSPTKHTDKINVVVSPFFTFQGYYLFINTSVVVCVCAKYNISYTRYTLDLNYTGVLFCQ